MKNLDIEFNVDDADKSFKSAIYAVGGATVDLYGDINIKTLGDLAVGIYANSSSILNVYSDAQINIKTLGIKGYGFRTLDESICNIKSGADVNINTSGEIGYGIYTLANSQTNIAGNIQITTLGVDGYGIVNSGYDSGNYTFVASTAQIYFNTSNSEIYHDQNRGGGNNILEIAQGAKLAFEKNDNVKWYEASQDYKDENDSGANKYIRADNITTMIPGIAKTTPWVLPTEIEIDDEDDTNAKVNVTEYQNQFNTVLGEYNKLINDCSYQGINLLKGGNLKVVFNEHRSNVFNVLGQDITATAIGLNEASAQYLSLQTRQQLALNSLSLAAQSAQSVLSLFN